MTPEAQVIAIAKACGWKLILKGTIDKFGGYYARGVWLSPSGNDEELPDYLNDLNAMHEAEKVLDDTVGAHGEYVGWLSLNEGLMEWGYATAAQRAEAFLRTLNLWTDKS